MRYRELKESFDKIVPFNWANFEDDTIKIYRADFQIEDGHYIVEFKEKYYQRGYWELSFVRNESLDLSRTGHASSVIATVIQITREFIRAVDPQHINFLAKNEEASRNRLYPKLILLLQKEFPEYIENDPKKLRTYTGYELSRPRKFIAPHITKSAEVENTELTDDEWEEIEKLVNELTR